MADSKGRGKMKLNLREIVQGACMIGVFAGFLLIDSFFLVGAIIALTCIGIYFLLEII